MKNLTECFKKGYDDTIKGFIVLGTIGIVAAVIKDTVKDGI